MSIESEESLPAQGQLLVHFFLEDQSHVMDALVLHACEGEVLALVKEVGKQLGIELRIESRAYGEGGLEVYLNFIGKHAVSLTLLGGVVTGICSATVWMRYQSKLLDQQVEMNAFALERDKKLSIQQIELNDLNLKKTRLELKKLEQEAAADAPRLPATGSTLSLHIDEPPTVEAVLPALLGNRRIIKLRSQFYESLLGYSKVSAVGFAPTHKPQPEQERIIKRPSFEEFIVRLEELEPTRIEKAEIEIIAPVLIRDGGKWRGRFEGRVISFLISDDLFLAKVAQKRVKFQNGTTLVCRLMIHLREDDAGNIEPHDYVVEDVHSHHARSGETMVRVTPPRNKADFVVAEPRKDVGTADPQMVLEDPEG
ncbi:MULTISPECIES: hypothetical protein [unclassified Variovorax]|uniref:hypothetical protein n=1 Tax=unclassified Variovorax TaxID=663243 RepID=UPI0025763330|nr:MULTISPECIES: hypothetical protein [unclassified Variovorax]MDM0086081.1 hypothetical protein [Variovorax sp. J22G40]MDM0145662.1 hypothetical protein [Variovorax sp. J2P1-31]